MSKNEFKKVKIGGVYVYVQDEEARNQILLLQDAYEALTRSDIVVGALPESGVANTIYRVPGDHTYTDYMWTGSEFVQLAVYNIDTVLPQLGYYVCDSAASATAKTVNAQGYALMVGGSVKITFVNANTAQNPTLNINSQGAKPIIYEGEAASLGNSWLAGETVEVFYDGTNYVARSIDDTLASNLKNWAARSALNVDSVINERIRTTAGDNSIDSSKGGKILGLIAESDFYASAFKTTGFNLLHDAKPIGDGYYFEVPALPFGAFGTASQPNGVLFTNSSNQNLQPSVRFKKYSDGVPASVNDGNVCEYTDSNGYRFYTTDEPGYMIVTGITFADTCPHIGWSRRYDDFVSPVEASDAGTEIDLTPIYTWLHPDVMKMLTVGSGANLISDEAERISDVAMKCHRNVGLAKNLSWTTVADEVEEGLVQTYTHSAVISAMSPNGLAEFYGTNMPLTVDGTTVSYQDTLNSATDTYVKYQIASPASGNVSVPTIMALEDWGLEILVGFAGSVIVVTQYAQGYPDALAALLANMDLSTLPVIAAAIAHLQEQVNGLLHGIEHGLPSLKVQHLKVARRMDANITEGNFRLIGEGAPTMIPQSNGQEYYDKTNGVWYKAGFTTSEPTASAWKRITNP